MQSAARNGRSRLRRREVALQGFPVELDPAPRGVLVLVVRDVAVDEDQPRRVPLLREVEHDLRVEIVLREVRRPRDLREFCVKTYISSQPIFRPSANRTFPSNVGLFIQYGLASRECPSSRTRIHGVGLTINRRIWFFGIPVSPALDDTQEFDEGELIFLGGRIGCKLS